MMATKYDPEKYEETFVSDEEDLDLPWLVVSTATSWQESAQREEAIYIPMSEEEEIRCAEAERLVLWREENGQQSNFGEGEVVYAGLIALQADAEEPGSCVPPESFNCPQCRGTTWMDPELSDHGGYYYWCHECGASMMLEKRTYLPNAAVLWLFPDALANGTS